MNHALINKVIAILSPQPWNHSHISKHHYAIELARNNRVYFISPPSHNWNRKYTIKPGRDNLFLIAYSVPLPEWAKFKFSWLYRAIAKLLLKRLIRKSFKAVDYCFDFGCYQQFNSIDFF